MGQIVCTIYFTNCSTELKSMAILSEELTLEVKLEQIFPELFAL